MKIRMGFVSNSSSSSFVVKNFNRGLIEPLLLEFVESVDCGDFELYSNDPEIKKHYDKYKYGIKQCMMNKMHLSEKKLEFYLSIYVKGQINSLFNALFDYYIAKRNLDLSNCENCCYHKDINRGNKGKCKGCMYLFDYHHMIEKDERIKWYKNDFPEFSFDDKEQEIEKLVANFEVVENDGSKVVAPDWKVFYKLTDKWEDEYYAVWREKYPNAFVFSFASDDGDDTEMFMRCHINEFVSFMRKHDVDGFRGENS